MRNFDRGNFVRPLYDGRPQNSPYFWVFKYARAVKQKVWNDAENRERDWGETINFFFSRLARPTRVQKEKPYRNTKTCHNLYYNFFSLPDFTKYGALCQSNFIRGMSWLHQIVTSHFMTSFLLLPHKFFKGTHRKPKGCISKITIRCYLPVF